MNQYECYKVTISYLSYGAREALANMLKSWDDPTRVKHISKAAIEAEVDKSHEVVKHTTLVGILPDPDFNPIEVACASILGGDHAFWRECRVVVESVERLGSIHTADHDDAIWRLGEAYETMAQQAD